MGRLPDTIEASPLELRRWRLSAIDDLVAAIECSQPELARWLPWADPMPTRVTSQDQRSVRACHLFTSVPDEKV
jgi:hypothetical protein